MLICSDLGYSFDNLGEGPPNEYSVAVKNLVFVFNLLIYSKTACSHLTLFIIRRPALFGLHVIRRFLPYVSNIGPPGFRRFFVKLLPFRKVQKVREIVDILDKTSVDIFQAKKAALQQGDGALLKQVGHGKDIMSILCM